jgi:phosphatidylserine/phosphatidylglycerophosphate/cardiolipin synthase-like enzyme
MSVFRPGDTCWRTAPASRAAFLIDNEAFFTAAFEAIQNARRSILLLGWGFDPRTRMFPDGYDGPDDPDEVGRILVELARARPELDIRLLVWKSALPISASQEFFPHKAWAFFKNTPVKFVLDDAVPFGACHHQKVLVIDDEVAFCGGGDIGVDRWDSPEHLDGDRRRQMPFGGLHDPRHEVMMMMSGPAAKALGDLARQRWTRATGQRLDPPPPSGADPWPDGIAPEFRDVEIGISRTLPAWRGREEVRESEALHLEAIATARQSIYLENQYVASPAIGEALAARLEEADGPEVVIVSTEHSPSWFDRATMDKTRSALLRRLQQADKHGRFHAYCPETIDGKTIIVHAKVSIIDDRLLRAGSTNLNNRSTGFDTECDVALEADEGPAGEATRAAIRRYRSRTIAHFLGHEADTFDRALARSGSLSGAIEALDTADRRRLRRLGPVQIGPLASLIATFHLGDPAAPTDSWRPWRRRAEIREEIRRLAPALADAPLIADPDHPSQAPAPADEDVRRPRRPALKGEDFIQSD